MQIKPVYADQPVCVPTSISFISENCTDSTCSWSYEVCQSGYALSHWNLGICDWLASHVVEVGFIDGQGNNVIMPPCPAEPGLPCWSYGYDSTTDLTGLKWDNLPGPENECWTLYFILDINLPEAELEWTSKYDACEPAGGTVTGPACDIVPGDIIAFKYYDENKNGEYDEGDYALENWEICLQTAGNGSPVCKSTNGFGLVEFEDLPPGNYTVYEIMQAGWINSDPGTSPISKEVAVQEGDTSYVEFGNWKPSQLREQDGDGEYQVGITVMPVDKVGLVMPWAVLAGLFVLAIGFSLSAARLNKR